MKHTAIGIRLPKEVLSRIEKLSREEHEDRSTIIRKLVILGYADLVKERAAARYRSDNITLSEAAHQAGLTVWEMEKYVVDRGYESAYSIEDLDRELHLLSSRPQTAR